MFRSFVLLLTTNSMKRNIFLSLLLGCAITCAAQEVNKPFKKYLRNDEYGVYIRINLHDSDISVPNHEIYGQLPGYLGKDHNSFFWVITSAKVVNGKKAELDLINDYGSEDLTATLTVKNDTTYILRQEDGSTLKVPNKGKWQKLPKVLEFKIKN